MLLRNICLFVALCLALSTNAQSGKDNLDKLLIAEQNAYDNHSDSLGYYYRAATALALKLNDIVSETRAKRIYGIGLFVNGQPDTAIAVLMNAAKKAEKYPPNAELALLYYGIAQVYSKNRYQESSRDYLRKGISIAIAVQNTSAIGDGYNRIGIDYEKRGELDSAMYYYQLALTNNQQDSSLLLGQAYSLENVAGIYAQQNNIQAALQYQKKALAIKQRVGKKIDIGIGNINIAESLDVLKQSDSALRYAQIALDIAREIEYKDLVSYTYQFLSSVYEKRGDYNKALAYHKMHSALKDSILNEKVAKQMTDADRKYQVEKKEQRIMDLSQRATIQNLQIKQRSTLLYFISGLFILSAVAAYLFYNRRKLKAEARLQAEIHKQQAITTREVLIAEEKERKRIAADLHDGVGQLLSASLMNLNGFFGKRNVDKQTDPDAARIMTLVTESYDELRAISHQMMPKALTKSGLESAVQEMLSGIDPVKMAVTFECIDLGRLDEDIETVLYRVIQESVNNVIKHAGARTLNVQLVRDDDGVSVTIEDDGKGFDMKNVKKNGIGLKNIYSRINLQNGTVDIDSQPGAGTVVAIHIPV